MVPNGWSIKRVDTFCDVCSSKRIMQSDYVSQGVPFYRSKEIILKSKGIVPTDIIYIDYEKFNSLREKFGVPSEGDILISAVGTLGKCYLVKSNEEFYFKDGNLLWLRNLKEITQAYLIQYMNAPSFQNQIQNITGGSSQKALTIVKLSGVELLLPPLPEQRKIAQILATWDQAITTTEQLIANSKQQKKALMQQLLTGKKRLLDLETGKAFEGEWKEVKLKAITQFIKDGTHGTHKRYDKGVPMLSAANITKNHKVNFEGAPNISHDDYNKIHSKYEINEGDILLTVVGTLGRVALVPKAMKFTLQRSVAIIRTSNKASNQFLMQVFSSKEFNNLLMSKSNSTAQAGVYLGELAKIKLLLPSLEEQQKIASVLTAADKDIELLETKLAHLKQEKKALMQQLLTGKRRVQVAEAEMA